MEIRLTHGEAQRGTRDPGLATCIRRIKTSSPTTQGISFRLGEMASKEVVQLIITEALAMQIATSPAQLPPRNRHRMQLGWFRGGAVAACSQRMSPWTAAPKCCREREKKTCVAFI